MSISENKFGVERVKLGGIEQVTIYKAHFFRKPITPNEAMELAARLAHAAQQSGATVQFLDALHEVGTEPETAPAAVELISPDPGPGLPAVTHEVKPAPHFSAPAHDVKPKGKK